MKKPNLRISALFILLLLFSGVALSCSVGEEKPSEVELSDLPIYDYAIVRGDDSGNAVLKQVLVLKDAIESRYSNAPAVSTDWSAMIDDATEKDAETLPEILVGITNRPESKAVNAELEGKYGYICRTVGNKIIITGSTAALLEQAVELFIKDCLTPSSGGYLPANINKTYFEKNTLYYSETEDSKPVLYIPINASPVLIETVTLFSERLFELSGITVTPQRTRLFEHTAILTLSDAAFPVVENYKGTGWLLDASVSTNSLILQGESDEALIYAISDLFRYFEGHYTKMLTGEPRMYFSFTRMYGEIEIPFVPAVLGGSFIGSESVSAACDVYYFENVSTKEHTAYQEYLKNYCGYTRLYTDVNARFLSEDETLELQLLYDNERQILSVMATGAKNKSEP